jgi:hypothetical protein
VKWRPLISAATFGLSELRWSELRQSGRRGVGLLLLGTLVLVIPVCWLIGLLVGGIFGHAFGVNLRGYNRETGASNLEDNIRYIWVGFVIALVGVWVTRVLIASSKQWGSWFAKRRLDKQPAAGDRGR